MVNDSEIISQIAPETLSPKQRMEEAGKILAAAMIRKHIQDIKKEREV